MFFVVKDEYGQKCYINPDYIKFARAERGENQFREKLRLSFGQHSVVLSDPLEIGKVIDNMNTCLGATDG